MRFSLKKTTITTLTIYSVLFSFPMTYMPYSANAEVVAPRDTLSCPEAASQLEASKQRNEKPNVAYLLKTRGCIPDTVTALSKLMLAIRLLDDQGMTRKKYNNPTLVTVEPSTEWQRAHALILDVERLNQDNHESRIPETTRRLIRAAANLTERFYDRSWWAQQCNIMQASLFGAPDCLSRLFSFGNARNGDQVWHSPGLIPRALLYAAVTQMRYRANTGSTGDIAVLENLAKAYLAPGVDPKKVVFHYPEDKEAYNAENYRLKYALISQYNVQPGNMHGGTEAKGGLGFYANAEETESGFRQLDMALKEVDITLTEWALSKAQSGVIAVLNFFGTKDRQDEGLMEYCRTHPDVDACRVKGQPRKNVDAKPPGPIDPIAGRSESEPEDPRTTKEQVVEKAALEFADKLKEKGNALRDKLNDRYGLRNEIAEANQFVNVSLLIQGISDPMSAYVDPMVRDFMSKFKVEVPALSIVAESKEHLIALAGQFTSMMEAYKSDLKSSAGTEGFGNIMNSKKTGLSLGGGSSEVELGENEATLAQLLTKSGRIIPLSETLDAKLFVNTNRSGSEFMVNFVVKTDRNLASPFFTIESLRFVMSSLQWVAKARDRFLVAFQSPMGKGFWKGAKLLSIRALYIIARVQLGNFNEEPGGSGGFGRSAGPGAPSLSNLQVGGAAAGVIDNSASQNPAVRSWIDRVLKYSRQGFIPIRIDARSGSKFYKPDVSTGHAAVVNKAQNEYPVMGPANKAPGLRIRGALYFRDGLTILFHAQAIFKLIYLLRVYQTTNSRTQFYNAAARTAAEIAHASLYIPGRHLLSITAMKGLWNNVVQTKNFVKTGTLKGLKPISVESPFFARIAKYTFYWDLIAAGNNSLRPQEPLPTVGDVMFNMISSVFLDKFVDENKVDWADTDVNRARNRYVSQVLRAEGQAGFTHSLVASKCAEKDILESKYFSDNALANYKLATACEIWRDFKVSMAKTSALLQTANLAEAERLKAIGEGKRALDTFNESTANMALGMIRVHYLVTLSINNSSQPALATRLQYYEKVMEGLRRIRDEYYKTNADFKIVSTAVQEFKGDKGPGQKIEDPKGDQDKLDLNSDKILKEQDDFLKQVGIVSKDEKLK